MKSLNQKGFALAMMVALLPVILAAGLASYAAISFLQIEQRFLYICRSGGIAGQEKAGKQIEALLHLNTKATLLIAKEKSARAALVAAEAAGNAYAAAAAETRLRMVQAEQEVLNLRQKEILLQGNLALQMAQQYTASKLGILTSDLTDYKSLFETNARIQTHSAPRMAVSPEGTDIAPTYRTNPDIEQSQVLVQQWQYQLRVQKHLQNFISGDFKFKQSCSVSITDRGGSWVPKILRDKY